MKLPFTGKKEEKKADACATLPEGSAEAERCNQAQHGSKYARPDKPTVGEEWWHKLTYTGVNYMANLVVSIAIVDWFQRSHRGQQSMELLKNSLKKSLEGSGMSAAGAEKMGGDLAKYATYPLGGHFVMAPVKILEDKARYLSHVFNQMLDPDYKYKDLKADWNTPDNELPPLTDEPTKNTWSEIGLRRGLGWGVVTAIGAASGKVGADKWVEDKTIGGVQSVVKSLPGGAKLMQSPTFQSWLTIGALDAYFTVVTSVVTEMTKTTFGKRKNGHEPESSPEIAANNGQVPPTPFVYTEQVSAPQQEQRSKRLKKEDNFTDRHASEAATPPHLSV